MIVMIYQFVLYSSDHIIEFNTETDGRAAAAVPERRPDGGDGSPSQS